MLKRIYVNNFRCFQNFEFKPLEQSSSLLIGKNGSGKSTLCAALKVFQAIGRGVQNTSDILNRDDFFLNKSNTPTHSESEANNIPIHFELEAKIGGGDFKYTLSLEWPENFRASRVKEESLSLDGTVLFSRQSALVALRRTASTSDEVNFNLDWHVLALPIIHDPAASDPINAFRQWLGKMVLINPVPRLMGGAAAHGTIHLNEYASNWGDWLSDLLDRYPAAYSTIIGFLKNLMPDLEDFRFDRTGKDSKELILRFKGANKEYQPSSVSLSDGEKCFFLCAVVLAVNQYDGPVLTFWDEPDSHLSLDEVSHFVMALRRGFGRGGQLIMTSHNPEAIQRFSDENTWVLGRRSHLEPSVIRPLGDLSSGVDLIQQLIDGGITV